MGLIDRLRELLPFGGAGATGPADAGEGREAAGERRCAICGTRVGPDASQCSLCHSTDLVPVGEGTDDRADAAADDGGGPDDVVTDARSPGATDEAAERLSELREAEETTEGDGTED